MPVETTRRKLHIPGLSDAYLITTSGFNQPFPYETATQKQNTLPVLFTADRCSHFTFVLPGADQKSTGGAKCFKPGIQCLRPVRKQIQFSVKTGEQHLIDRANYSKRLRPRPRPAVSRRRHRRDCAVGFTPARDQRRQIAARLDKSRSGRNRPPRITAMAHIGA